jgi:hypothetical protein
MAPETVTADDILETDQGGDAEVDLEQYLPTEGEMAEVDEVYDDHGLYRVEYEEALIRMVQARTGGETEHVRRAVQCAIIQSQRDGMFHWERQLAQ